MELFLDDLLRAEVQSPGSDRRFGLNLVARLPSELVQAIGEIQAALAEISPGQYYYPEGDLHLTVLSLLSSRPEAETLRGAGAVAEALPEVLAGLEPVTLSRPIVRWKQDAGFIQLLGGAGLLELRREIAGRLEARGLPSRPRYLNDVAHVTFQRYLNPVRDLERWAAAWAGARVPELSWRLDEVWLTQGATWYGRRGRLTERGPFGVGCPRALSRIG